MAVEIEKLIGVLEGDTKHFDVSMERATGRLDKFKEKGTRTGSVISASFRRMGRAVGIVTAAISTALGIKALKFTTEVERQNLRIEALLRATGNAAGYTAKQLDSLARGVGAATLASPEGVRQAIAVLLTFKRIRGPIFKRTIELSQDLAEAMGGNLRDATLQLAKALEEPEIGLGFLRRAGVSFSEAEKTQIMDLQEANKAFDAQSLILDKIAGQLGGTGAGAGAGLSGKVDLLGQRFNELTETIVDATGVGTLWGWIVDRTREAITGLDLAITRATKSSEEYRTRVVEVFGSTQEAMDATSLSARRLTGSFEPLEATTAAARKEKKRADDIKKIIDRLEEEHRALSLTSDQLVAYQLSQQGATQEEIARAVALERVNSAIEKQDDLIKQQATAVRGETFALGGVQGTVSKPSTPAGGVQKVQDVDTRQVVQILRQIEEKLGTGGAAAVAS